MSETNNNGETFDIFSQMIVNHTKEETTFIRLSTNFDCGMYLIKPLSINIQVGVNRISPLILIRVVDGNGDFYNHLQPNMDTLFYLDIGRELTDSKRLTLRLSELRGNNKKSSTSEQVDFVMVLIHSEWMDINDTQHNRSWGNPTLKTLLPSLIGDTVTDYNIGNSLTLMAETIIQNNQTTTSLLQTIVDEVTSDEGGRPIYFGDVDGSFTFKTTGEIIEEQRNLAINKEIPILRMEGQEKNPDVRNSEYKENLQTPTYISKYNIIEDTVSGIQKGAVGYKTYHYDFFTDSFVTNDVGARDSDTPILSDWVKVPESHADKVKRMYGGRNPNVVNKARRENISQADSMVKVEVVMEGTIHHKIGQIVELIIPINTHDTGSVATHSVMYSGFYMIRHIEHRVDCAKSQMTTILLLARDGIDGKQIEGYTTTNRGKFVEK